MPAGLIVMLGDMVYHVPPLFPLEVNKVDEPAHIVAGPLMVPAVALALTETVNEEEAAPHIFDTV
jgi:hypothetical protein